MQNTITVPQRLTYKEFLSAMLYVFASSRRARRFLLFLFIAFCSINLLSFITNPTRLLGIGDLENMLMVLGSMPVGGIVFIIIGTFLIYQTRPELFSNVSYHFSHWGVIGELKGGGFSKPWREIYRFKETKQFFLLYITALDVHIIQKKMIGDVERINIFRSMLEENVGAR